MEHTEHWAAWAKTSSSLAIYFVFCALGACSSTTSTGESDAEDVTPIATKRIERSSITRSLSYSGDVHGEVEIRVFSVIPDRIASLRVVEGQQVERGEVIAIVRAQALGQGVQQAMGGLGAARAQAAGLRDTLGRQRRLLSSGVVTQAQVDATSFQLRAAESQALQLEATVGSARSRRSDATVRSPISGVVGQVFLEEGDLAPPQVPVCTVVQMDRVEVVFQASERDLGQVRTGMEAELRFDSVPDRLFRAPITRLSPVIDRLSRTATARIELENPDHLIRPGSLAEINVSVERHDDAIVVPQYALVLDEQVVGGESEATYRAYVIENNRAVERDVTVGLYSGNEVEILSGLAPGDHLVIQGQHLLRDGSLTRHAGRDAASTSDAGGE